MPRRKKSAAGSAFDDAAATLYSLPPEEFIDARADLAAHAREGGDRELAARIRALKKPTHAAWALNQLSREHPDDIVALLDLGAELRQAYTELSAERMRKVSEQRRERVSALTRQVKALAAERGVRLGDAAEGQITESLEAALADSDAASQLNSGQLTTALHPPPAFPFASAAPKAPAAPARHPPSHGPRARAEDKAAQRKERERQEQERQALADVERAAGEADEEARSAEEELASQEEQLLQARRAADNLKARVEDLNEQLDHARDEAREADHSLREVRRSRDAAAHRAQQARQQAQRARERWQQLRQG